METHQETRNLYLTGVNRLTAALLLLATAPWPNSYYIFLRWFVLLSALVHIGFSISRHCPLGMLVLVFVPMALLFNPIEPVYLSKGAWVIIDVFAAMFVVVGHEELNKD